MLKIRLQKIGKKNDPSYRIALVEHTTSTQGKFIELLGTYSPKLKQKQFNKERIGYWLTKGAQASPTVHNLLVEEKIINEAKVKSWKPKKKRSEAKSSEATGEGGKAPASETPKTEEQPITETPTGPVKVDLPVEASAESGEPKVEPVPETTKLEEPKTEEIKPTEEPKPEVPPAGGIPPEGEETPTLDTEPKKE